MGLQRVSGSLLLSNCFAKSYFLLGTLQAAMTGRWPEGLCHSSGEAAGLQELQKEVGTALPIVLRGT